MSMPQEGPRSRHSVTYARNMRTRLIAGSALLTLALAGCASGGSDAQQSPSPTADANAAACSSFGNTTTELGTLITTSADELGGFDTYKKRLDAVPDRFDKAALQADGDVADRMDALVTNLPDDLADLALSSDDYSADVKRVYNACEAGGYPVGSFAVLSED